MMIVCIVLAVVHLARSIQRRANVHRAAQHAWYAVAMVFGALFFWSRMLVGDAGIKDIVGYVFFAGMVVGIIGAWNQRRIARRQR